MKEKVIAGKVLIRPETPVGKTAGGIIIPETAKKKEVKGEVVAVGVSLDGELVQVKEGDTILISVHSGIKVEIEEEQFILINHKDIFYIY